MKTILYVEEDVNIGEWIKEELENSEYKVLWFKAVKDIFLHLNNADIVILDMLLPGFDCFTIRRRIKEAYPQLPIIILSAGISLEDKIRGLKFSDDYLTKPFYPSELIARIEVLLKKYNNYKVDRFTVGHLEIYPNKHRVVNIYTHEDVILSDKQSQLFFYFINHINQTLTREQIFEAIWKKPYVHSDQTLMVNIEQLRGKIELNPINPKIIKTIHDIGFKFQI
jgi:DNA-binding response OmpR family regulator